MCGLICIDINSKLNTWANLELYFDNKRIALFYEQLYTSENDIVFCIQIKIFTFF